MHLLLIATIIALTASPSLAAPTKPMTEEAKTLYGVGLVIARQLSVLHLTPQELKLVQQGLADGVTGKPPLVDFATYSKKSQELGLTRRDAHGRKLAGQARDYMDKAAKERGAIRTENGVIYRSLKEGTGERPTDNDKVRLHYRGMLIDGTEIENTYKGGEPDDVPVGNLLRCLSDGVKMMKAGGRARLVCPPDTAFGQEGSGAIPPEATLVIEMEFLAIM